jgi:hypothetical protein
MTLALFRPGYRYYHAPRLSSMRIPILFVAAALSGFPPASAAPLLKFQSTGDYMHQCGVAQPGADCRQAFVQASNWVRFNSDARICAPDEKQSFGSPDYDAAVNGEVASLIAWLKQNAGSVSLDYVRNLGEGLIALYACQ